MSTTPKIYVGGYHGQSLISKIIKAVTWGDFSHVALIRDDGQTIEAWHIGGVQHNKTPWILHTPETKITIFELLYPEGYHQAVWDSALKKVGQGYDFIALTGFIPGLRRIWKNNPLKWFCSHEVVNDCHLGGNLRLFNSTVPQYKIDPSYLVSSIWLRPIGQAKNMAEFLNTTNKQNTNRNT